MVNTSIVEVCDVARAAVVTAVVVEGRPKAQVARAYGISQTWVHELVGRFEAHGEAGLAPRSRRPHSNPGQVDRALEDEIVALRKQLHDQGLDAGAATIAAHLTRRHGAAPGRWGKQVAGLRVVDRVGRRLSPWRASTRSALCVLFPAGLLWVLASRRNDSLQDLVVGTAVIYDWVSHPVDG